MKKILIAVDYGPTAQKVAETGYALGKKLTADVLLLHVVSEPTHYAYNAYSPIMGFAGYTGADLMDAELTESLLHGSEQYLQKTKSHLGGDHIETEVVVGSNAADTILKAIRKHDIDLVVVGSHSHRWMEDVLLGNVTQKILRESLVPVLVVPSKRHSL
jgi:nucleotide-binding universal stress UspA family protein